MAYEDNSVHSVQSALKWYHDKYGKPSAMRLVTMLSTATGCVCVLAGIVGMFAGLHDAGTAMVTGAGMTGLGEVAKAFQSRRE